MKFVRKFFAIILVLLVIVLLPVSLILKNADGVLFSQEEMSDLIEERFITTEIITETIQSKIAPEISNIQSDPLININWTDALDPLTDEDWVTISEHVAPQEDVSALVSPLLSDLYAWLNGDTSTPDVTIDLRFLKENTSQSVSDFASLVIDKQHSTLPECSPEQTEYYFPEEVTAAAEVGLETPEGINASLTIYHIIITNKNQFTSYTLDDMKIYALGEDKRLKSNMSVPSCAAFIEEEIKPNTEIRCKVDAQTGLIEDIKDTLEITTTIIEPSELNVCITPTTYDPAIKILVEPVLSTAVTNTVNTKFPEEYSTKYFPAEDMAMVIKYAQQGRLAAKYGWMGAAGLLLIAALLGMDKFKGFFGWIGWPLLFAGGILLAVYYMAKDMLWPVIAPILGQGTPDYLKTPIQAFYDELLTMIKSPMMMQALLILGAGLVAIVLAFVFRSKKTGATLEEKEEVEE